MKKLLIIALIVFISTIGLIFNSFGAQEPQYGGIMRIVAPAGGRTFYFPEGGPRI